MNGAIKHPLRHTQYSVHPPTQFICTHLDQLLPEWSCAARSVLIVLQPCDSDLFARSRTVEDQKQRLRRQFLRFGYRVATQIAHLGEATAIFDPRTGWPLLSRPGQLRLDDVAVIRACLGYQTVDSHGCLIIFHPQWQSAVYPSTLITSAAPATVKQLVGTMTGIMAS